jgi:hypothetical protein
MSNDRSLDEEGVPDLDGPLPEKAATGDGQEGLLPPSSRPASLDWGTTAKEQRQREPLSAKISRERADVTGRATDHDEGIELVEPEPHDGQLIADAVESEQALSPEEAAMHFVETDR